MAVLMEFEFVAVGERRDTAWLVMEWAAANCCAQAPAHQPPLPSNSHWARKGATACPF
jgi:hypothetical protein